MSASIIGTTAVLLNTVTLLAVVGGHEVTNLFEVTEVYAHKGDDWTMVALSFTKLLTPPGETWDPSKVRSRERAWPCQCLFQDRLRSLGSRLRDPTCTSTGSSALLHADRTRHMPTWFITGCSTGLGRHLAEALLRAGNQVVVTARNLRDVEDLLSRYPGHAYGVSLDVTDQAQIAEAVESAIERFGQIDVLVNNAGYGYRSAVEEGDPADVEALFATNFFGPVNLIKAVLPGMRARRRGVIVNISSIAVRITPAGSGYYAAVKGALEGMSGSLRKELEPLGISVIVVEPGGFRTDFGGRSLKQSPEPIDDYAETAGKRRKENDTAHPSRGGDPAKAAQSMITAVESPNPPAVLVLGAPTVGMFRDELDARRAELDAWEEVSSSTGM